MPDNQGTTEAASFESAYAMVVDDSMINTVTRPVDLPRPAVPGIRPEVSGRLRELSIQGAFLRYDSGDWASTQPMIYPYAKRALDLCLTIPALILLSPILLTIALLVRLDSDGPAFFKQQRVGQNGRLFTMYKFRSMSNGSRVHVGGRIHKIENDSRVTRVGRVLRQTSLDELPQLINVALGQMSLVGPRPELPEIVLTHYQPWQYQRLSVPQGITGWWQVTGRGKKLLWKHTRDDLYYVERASFWFDLKLLFMTIRAVISRDGAF